MAHFLSSGYCHIKFFIYLCRAFEKNKWVLRATKKGLVR